MISHSSFNRDARLLTRMFHKLWGAHAPPRVPVGASPTVWASKAPTVRRKQEVQVWGEAPQTAREARALPKLMCEISGLSCPS